MTQTERHPDERIDDWIDGRLDSEQRAALELHFDVCPECRGLRDRLLATRRALREELSDGPVPAGLEARILGALDREDERRLRPARRPPARTRRLPGLLPLAAGILLAALASILFLRPFESDRDLVASAFREHERLTGAELPASIRATGVEPIEARWREAALDFPARVLDLSAMGISLVGGDATRLGTAPAARSVYASDLGRIVCWMFRGTEDELPEPVRVHRERGFTFRVYREGERTLVVWREGEVLCALAAAADAETVLSLAVAKAMAPPVRT